LEIPEMLRMSPMALGLYGVGDEGGAMHVYAYLSPRPPKLMGVAKKRGTRASLDMLQKWSRP
jgi:hypothetical protein